MKLEEREAWILAAVQEEQGLDVLNRVFVEQYVAATGAAVREVYWGAPHCRQLGADLSRLARKKKLSRRRIGLSGGAWMPGFPKWVWVYRLPGTWLVALALAFTPTLAPAVTSDAFVYTACFTTDRAEADLVVKGAAQSSPSETAKVRADACVWLISQKANGAASSACDRAEVFVYVDPAPAAGNLAGKTYYISASKERCR
jgi:hypothetical protein